MNNAYRILGIAAIFLLVTIVAVFATDALTSDNGSDQTETEAAVPAGNGDTDTPPTTEDVNMDADVPVPVDVVSAYWADTSAAEDQPIPPPEVDPDAAAESTGIQVLRPPSGEPADHPENQEQPFDFDAGPVPVEDIEAEAAEQAQDELAADEPPPNQVDPVPAAATIGRRIDLPSRFADPCAIFAEGACPIGLPALVRIFAPQETLQLATTVYRGEVGRAENGTEGCPADFVEGEFNMWVATSIPSRLDVTYHQSLPPGSFTTLVLAAPGPGDPEYDRWVESQSNGEFDDNNTWTWFRRCLVLDLEPDAFYEFNPITVTSIDGQVLTHHRILSINTVTPGETIGKPPPTFAYGDGSNLTVHVWKKSVDGGYRSYVWPIDLSDPESATCSEVEDELFADGGRIGTSHPDFRIAAVPYDARPATPHEIYDSEYTSIQRFDMALREGRTYTLCVWEAKLGTASFDEWEILDRDQYDVVTPSSHPLVMNLVRAGIRGDSTTHEVHVYAENHDYCDVRGPVLNATVEDVGEGTRIVREVFCESWGLPLDSVAFTRITVDNEVADVFAIPLDGLENCGTGTSDPGCDIRVSEYIDHTVEIPGSCDPDCAWVDLKFRLDYLPSNGAGTDTWGIGPAGTFEGMEPTEVAGPDVDTFSLKLEPVDGRVDQMTATFLLKSPSEYTITAIAPVPMRDGDTSCNSIRSGSGEGLVEVIMDGMCPDTLYVFESITMVDADGITTERNLFGTIARVWTNGYASRLRTDVSMTLVDQQGAAARCSETDSQGGFARGADEDCWNHFEVATTSPVALGGAQAYAINYPSCVSPIGTASAPFAAPPATRNQPTTGAVVLGDLVNIDFQFAVYVSPDCDAGGSSPGLFTLLAVHREVPFDFVNRGLIYTFPTEDGIEWTVHVTRTDQGVANRKA
jgi:hypothetical protein